MSLQKFALHSLVTSHAMYVDVQTAGGKSRKDKMGPKIYEVAFINCHSQIKSLVSHGKETYLYLCIIF